MIASRARIIEQISIRSNELVKMEFHIKKLIRILRLSAKMKNPVNIHSICMTGLPFSPLKGCPMFNNVNILISTANGEISSNTQKLYIYSLVFLCIHSPS